MARVLRSHLRYPILLALQTNILPLPVKGYSDVVLLIFFLAFGLVVNLCTLCLNIWGSIYDEKAINFTFYQLPLVANRFSSEDLTCLGQRHKYFGKICYLTLLPVFNPPPHPSKYLSHSKLLSTGPHCNLPTGHGLPLCSSSLLVSAVLSGTELPTQGAALTQFLHLIPKDVFWLMNSANPSTSHPKYFTSHQAQLTGSLEEYGLGLYPSNSPTQLGNTTDFLWKHKSMFVMFQTMGKNCKFLSHNKGNDL